MGFEEFSKTRRPKIWISVDGVQPEIPGKKLTSLREQVVFIYHEIFQAFPFIHSIPNGG